MDNAKTKKSAEQERGRAPGTRGPGGRKSKNNADLMNRRIEIYRLWSSGISKTEIATRFGLSVDAISLDIKAIAMLDDPKSAKDKIDSGYLEIIRRALDLAELEKDAFKIAALMRIAVDGLSHRAKLHGFEQTNNQFNISQTQILNTSGRNPYDGLDEKALEREIARRRFIGKDPAK